MDSSPKKAEGLKIELGFVQRRLPWIVGAAALAFYVITLNHSSTLAGLSSLANAAGWEWRSNLIAPLNVILTFPVRWLPSGLQLTCLNLIAAVCASLALALLARSVALLPHDRTREQRGLERSDHSLLSIGAAWLPPALAALVCGLQSSFWENAVVATGEALDLLIFAWLVHTLLQYRLDEKESRLSRFAFVYGLAIVNNHAMIGFLPAFLTALIWTKGLSFFRPRFLLRMAGCGVAGLLLYLLLPAMESASGASGYTFWELLRSYWGHQKNLLLGFPRFIVLFISLTSLLPALFMGIRWPAQFGEVSAVGNALTNLMTHVIHGVFLAAGIYVAFDPPFSPRSLSAGLGQYTLLPFYFLGALAIGYCSGYFLLVFGARPGPQAWQRPSPVRRIINGAVVAAVWAALVAAPAGLIVRNLPAIMANSGEAMDRLSRAVAKSLPETGAVVLSDDRFRLFSLQYELSKSNPGHKHILVDTASLVAPAYHEAMIKKHHERWPKFATTPHPRAMINPMSLVELLLYLQRSGPVYYLHPSFGYYFEVFYARPRGMVYELKLLPTNSIAGPALTAAEVKEQDAYWRSLKAAEIDPLFKKAAPFEKLKPGKFKPRPWTLDRYLAQIYSRALNHFGVELQRSGDMPLAGDYFDWAARLNPGNPAAWLNRDFNRRWRDGNKGAQKDNQEAVDRLAYFGGRWSASLSDNGPPDEPSACYVLAREFEQSGNYHQAGQFMERTLAFEPDNRSAQLVSALLHLNAQLGGIALQKTIAFRNRYGASGLTEDEEIDLLNAEAWARVVRNDIPAAERLLADAQRKFPRLSAPWDILADIYMQVERVTNALETLEKQLQAQPDSQAALAKFGGILLRLGRHSEALARLDRALQLNPANEQALFNRAMVHFALDRLDAAQRDFEALLKQAKSSYRVTAQYYLGEIHFRRKNRKDSLKYYEDFLKAAPLGTPQIPAVKERVKVLETGGAL
jgi:tetratricopeptide (TPR) repeat protein